MADMVKYPVYTRYYDWYASGKVKFTSGMVPLGEEVGIYLIFSHAGLLSSHVAVLEAMRADGISPLVVSNLPLSETDRSRLAGLSYLILERPNLGYDFGGYRDAILHLRPVIAELQRLWILNDSAWMIDQPETWFSQVRRLGVDFAAANYAHVKGNIKMAEVKDFWPPDSREPLFHYGSFALSVGPMVLRDSRFVRYWKRLGITVNKSHAVHYGETGLTRLLINGGFSHAVTCDFGPVEAKLASLSSEELERATRDAYFNYRGKRDLHEQVLATDPESEEGRKCRIDHLMFLVCSENPCLAIGIFAVRHMGFHFLKKSPARLSPNSRERMLEFAASLPQPQRDMICGEMRMLGAR